MQIKENKIDIWEVISQLKKITIIIKKRERKVDDNQFAKKEKRKNYIIRLCGVWRVWKIILISLIRFKLVLGYNFNKREILLR